MKYNKMFIVLALCAAMQPAINFGSQAPQSQSYWQQYAPQRAQDIGSYISQKATGTYQSVKDTVNTWSTRKKIIIAGSILTALAAVYNKDQIIQWVSNLLPEGTSKGFRRDLDFVGVDKVTTPTNVPKQTPELTTDQELTQAQKSLTWPLSNVYDSWYGISPEKRGEINELNNARRALGIKK